MPDVYWFTKHGNYVPYSSVHLHMEQHIPITELRVIVWEMIVGYAMAGNNLDRIIEKCQDADQSLIDYLNRLQADGYNCNGGIDMHPDYLKSLTSAGIINEASMNRFIKSRGNR